MRAKQDKVRFCAGSDSQMCALYAIDFNRSHCAFLVRLGKQTPLIDFTATNGIPQVCLWTKTASNEAVQIGLGKQFKEFLEFDQNCGYLAHVSTTASCLWRGSAKLGLLYCPGFTVLFRRCLSCN